MAGPNDGDETIERDVDADSSPELLLSEARRVVDEHITELDRTDKKAARSLQGMFVLFGLLISAQEFSSPDPVWTRGIRIVLISRVIG